MKYMANYNRDKQGNTLSVDKAVSCIQSASTCMQDMWQLNCDVKSSMVTKKSKKFKDSDDEASDNEDGEDE